MGIVNPEFTKGLGILHLSVYPRKSTRNHVPHYDMALDASQIGRWLKQAREAAKLTQHQAAEKSGVGYGVVTSAEQGRDPLATNFLALVKLYNADVKVLLSGRPAKPVDLRSTDVTQQVEEAGRAKKRTAKGT